MRLENQKSFNQLYERYNKLIYEIVFSILKQKEDSQDLVQIVFTKLYLYNVYEYNGNVSIKLDRPIDTLQNALLDNRITMEEIIQKANQDIADKKIKSNSYDHGGTIEYNYPSYTIIRLHQLNGNQDVYIGPKTMKLTDVVQ